MTSRSRGSGWLAARWRPWQVLFVLASVLAAAPLTAAAPAAAAARPVPDCTASSGVIVAVDFGHWGGPVLRSCGTTPTTGYALLNQGGWHTTGTDHDGPAFICRIGYNGYRRGTQYPTPQHEACVLTPAASDYWTSWQAGPGQDTWTYSRIGALRVHPAPGSVELWIFGGTNLSGTAGSAIPAIAPDAVRARSTGSAPAGEPAIVNASPLISNAPIRRGSPTPAVITLALVLLAAVGGTAARRRARAVR